jgi:hypothetical protein
MFRKITSKNLTGFQNLSGLVCEIICLTNCGWCTSTGGRKFPDHFKGKEMGHSRLTFFEEKR